MTVSCLRIPKGTVSTEPLRTFPLDSTRYRNYHPTLGRWIERDPIGYGDGINIYEYVTDSPTGHFDWSGQFGGYQPIGPQRPPSKQPAPAPTYTYEELLDLWNQQYKNRPAMNDVTQRADWVAKAMVKCSTNPVVKLGLQKFLLRAFATNKDYRGIVVVPGDVMGGAGWVSVGTKGELQIQSDPVWDPEKDRLKVPDYYGGGGNQDVFNRAGAMGALGGTGARTAFQRCTDKGTDSPTGLMHLAVVLSWEDAHFVGSKDVRSGAPTWRSQPNWAWMEQIWKQMDCCCLRTLLGNQPPETDLMKQGNPHSSTP